MSTRRNSGPIDGWDGMASEIAKHSKATLSQCVGCKHEIGTQACVIYGEKPYEYSSVLLNVKCPAKKVK